MSHRRKPTKRRTLAEKGREIVSDSKRDLRGELVLNCAPKAGMWLAHPQRKRCYGIVLRVKRNGQLVVTGAFGGPVTLAGSRLYAQGYEYRDEMPAGAGWTYLVDGSWTEAPPHSWPRLEVA